MRRPGLVMQETSLDDFTSSNGEMLVFQNTQPHTIYFEERTWGDPYLHRQEPSYLIHNPHEIWPPLAPGEYTALYMQKGRAYPQGVEDILVSLGCKGYRIQGLSKDWQPWAYIELYKMHRMQLMTTDITIVHHKYANHLHQYLVEKMPHKDPVIVYAKDVVGLLWLQGLSEKFWNRVIWTELRRFAEKRQFGISYSKQETSAGVDVKVYFLWNASHDVRMEPWDSMERIIKENDRAYVSYHHRRITVGTPHSSKEG